MLSVLLKIDKSIINFKCIYFYNFLFYQQFKKLDHGFFFWSEQCYNILKSSILECTTKLAYLRANNVLTNPINSSVYPDNRGPGWTRVFCVFTTVHKENVYIIILIRVYVYGVFQVLMSELKKKSYSYRMKLKIIFKHKMNIVDNLN